MIAAGGEEAANMALAATPSSSYCSGDTSLAVLNDGNRPANSLERGTGSYGNWPKRGTQWAQYDWSQPVSTNRIDVYWWDDHRGVRLPRACRLKYWDGKEFCEVKNAEGLGVSGDCFNVTTFDKVVTSRLRLEMDGRDEFSTGLLEWRVLDSGDSPPFPPTVVAGIDRSVVKGGKTYLSGRASALQGVEGLKLAWNKRSGPGEVRFADPRAAETTATFGTPGDYTLALEAEIDGMKGVDTLRVSVVEPPEKKRFDVVYTTPYRIDSPLWNDRARAMIVRWIPHCIDQINRSDLEKGPGGIDNFIEAAKALRGEPHGRHKGYVFSNAWVHQTIESMCIALMIDPRGDQEILAARKKFRATLDDWIPKILAAQEPDGYLQTAYTLADRKRWPARWNPPQRTHHEGYVAGYFIESAINHHRLTEGGDLRLYNAAKKLADCWVANIGPGKREWWDEHQGMEQALVRFGRFVNDIEGGGRGDAYIRLAMFLLDSRGGGNEYSQSHLPVQQHYEAVGHAVRAAYSYSAMADVAAETGDADYQSAVMSLWDNLVNRKYYVTGGIGSGETAEGFGEDYSLPHHGYCESCSSCAMVFFQWKLNLAYHDAKFADLYEETMYNALLGSLDLDGGNFYYDNPLVVNHPRNPWHVCPCCVGNIPRTLLMIPTWAYVKSDDGICVNLFIGSTVELGEVAGTDVQVVQETDYPWDGKVAITVNPEKVREFSLRIRVPQRSVSELYSAMPEADGLQSISLNGRAITPKVEKGYAVIRREWKKGDRVELVLPLVPQLVTPSEKIAATRGQVALRCGPLIYCVERADQDIRRPLDPAAPLKLEWKPDLLHGVTVIHGKWADGDPLLAIPYFARCNRDGTGKREGPSSTVWIKRKP